MSEAFEESNKEFVELQQTSIKSNEIDTSLNIKEFPIEQNKLEIQDSFNDKKNSESDSNTSKVKKDENIVNSHRYGLTIPSLFLGGEPYFLISPNCKIKIK